jgi:uncharacterized protein YndB with AHSA1/START domain
MSTDRFEKDVVLKAPRDRVWNAITDSQKFGAWFGMALDGPFVAGQCITGHIVPTTVDDEVARMQEPYRGKPAEWTVDRIEPKARFSFRWHPYAIEKGVDYSSEPTTLVMFELSDAPDGTALRVSESGFDALPESRRVAAFKAEEGGWTKQVELIAKYLAQNA